MATLFAPYVFLLTLLTPLAAEAQSLWGGAYVGMKADQIEALYPNAKSVPNIDGGNTIVGPQYRISNGNFDVAFHLQQGVLDTVTLSAGTRAFIDDLPQAQQTYLDLKKNLTIQYGQPLAVDDPLVSEADFITNTVSVSLMYMKVMGKPSITVTYAKTSGGAIPL